jgi:hypothetical protein
MDFRCSRTSGVMFGFNSPAEKKLFGAAWIAPNEIKEIRKSIKAI